MPKPKFDPNAPFEEVKPKFDPTQPYDAHEDPNPTLGERAKTFFEDTVVDQLPSLGAAGGGMVGGLAGNIPGAFAGAGIGGYTGKALQNAYNGIVRPEKAPHESSEYLSGPLRSAAEGVALEGVGQGVGHVIGSGVKALSPVGKYIAEKLGSGAKSMGERAAQLAEKATGATGKGSEKFVEGTGRELLDRGIVKFGSSPSGVAKNANRAIEAAEASKESIAGKLSGTNVDRNKVYNAIRKRIDELKGDESQVGLVKALESKLEDIAEVSNRTSSEVPFQKSEEIRRGFDKAAKWDSATDAPTREANRTAANAYREAGEQAATAADPALGAQYKADKTTQRLLIPVAEAAEKRAAQLKQSPLGGLLDIAAVGAGGTVLGGPAGGAAGLAAKALRPRLASMGAVSADTIAKTLAATPEVFGRFANILTGSAARGPKSFQTTLSLLSKDPEFMQTLDRIQVNPPVRNVASDRKAANE